MLFKKKEMSEEEEKEKAYTKDFFDLVCPTIIKFNTDSYIVGNTYRCVWAIREYPPVTHDMAILAQLADKTGVTVRIYHRAVDSIERDRLIQNTLRRNKVKSSGSNISDVVEAEGDIQDVIELISNQRTNRELLLHCAVYIELSADSSEGLHELQSDISMELARSKITVDKLLLRQKEGFLSVFPLGSNKFGDVFERVLPADSAANLFPFNFSGKNDENGIYIGRDKFGTNILVDFDKRTADKTNSNILILGNSGQGKSYLLKLLLTNLRESGKNIICLDPEEEYVQLCKNLGGCYIDYMSGSYIINPLEPKDWGEGSDEEGTRKKSVLSQHISFLKDFFRSYKDFTDAHLDTIEILLTKLYKCFGITDKTDCSRLSAESFPILRDLYNLCEDEFMHYDASKKQLYTEEQLQDICLGIHSMCIGAESRYFNGYTNIIDSNFLCFGVKGLMDTNKRLKDAMLFNILSYMNHQLLTKGNTVASIDELYLFLSNETTIEYIRNAMKRVRKKESSVILASQNIEDFLIPAVKELTKPMFSIPSHLFLFYPGQIDPDEFCDSLQLHESEYDLIRYPNRGSCLYKCGNERFLLQVSAPKFKEKLFGNAGGR